MNSVYIRIRVSVYPCYTYKRDKTGKAILDPKTGETVRRKCGWGFRWRDPVTGERRSKATGIKNRANADIKAREWQKYLEARAMGIESEDYSEQLARPIVEHVDEYLKAHKAGSESALWQQTVAKRLRRLVAECKWEKLTDIKPSTLQNFLAKQKCADKTRRDWVDLARTFASWCVTDSRMPQSIYDNLRKGVKRPKINDQRERRALEPQEIKTLLASVPKSRAYLYRVAIVTGLRAGELAKLTPAHFKWPCVVLPGRAADGSRNTKNKESAVQPLDAGTVKLLRPWVEKQPMDKPLWADQLGGGHNSRLLKNDMRRAGLDPTNVDFHSLRRTLVTLGHVAGVPTGVVQRLARHKDASLTVNTYSKLTDSHKQSAIDQIMGQI